MITNTVLGLLILITPPNPILTFQAPLLTENELLKLKTLSP